MAEQQQDGSDGCDGSAPRSSNQPANQLQQIAASIIASPRFQQAVVEILGETSAQTNNRPRPASGPATVTGPPATATNVAAPTSFSRTTAYGTMHDELRSIFNRGKGGRPRQSHLFGSRARGSRGNAASSVASSSRRNRQSATAKKPPYMLREIVLLESSKECTTARPPKKASLMERGEFILPAGICRKHLKLGAFSKSKKGTSLFIALGLCLQKPVFEGLP